MHLTMDITGIKYKGKVTVQNRDWNTTSVDKIKELRQVVDMAFEQMSALWNKDADAESFKKWNNNVHRALQPTL